LFVGLPVLLFSAVHTVDENAPWVRVVALVFVYLGTAGHVLAGAQYAVAMFAKRRTVPAA
jgi:cardiolipin synthase